ncbi:hypothetical protein F4805DRAFT_357978 [Annulohypoxylon moriforme]|nr:hypothetical protein F4805DRAFT_357978 [Annulohypoxylon moriforme]
MPSEKDVELCSNFSSLTTDTIMTPTNSDMASNHSTSEHTLSDKNHKGTVPWPGRTYIIRDIDTKLQITLVEGVICMQSHLGDQGGYHWKCVSKDGWLGFRNPSSGLYLGHDTLGHITAQVRHLDCCEFFVTRAHPDGGQMLLTKHGDELRQLLWNQYGIGETKEGGTVWEFMKV